MSDDATPRDVPAEEVPRPRSEHAKPSDESALATRVPSPAHREKATTSKYRGVRQRPWESWADGCAWDERACFEAAWGGHLESLQYLHENGCPWDDRACEAAARGGHLECLQYLHENGCPWGENTCFQAANHGHLESLRYAHENGCPLDLATVKFCLEKGWVWDDETSYIAATAGHMECLQYVLAIERGDHQIQALNKNEMEIATTMVALGGHEK